MSAPFAVQRMDRVLVQCGGAGGLAKIGGASRRRVGRSIRPPHWGGEAAEADRRGVWRQVHNGGWRTAVGAAGAPPASRRQQLNVGRSGVGGRAAGWREALFLAHQGQICFLPHACWRQLRCSSELRSFKIPRTCLPKILVVMSPTLWGGARLGRTARRCRTCGADSGTSPGGAAHVRQCRSAVAARADRTRQCRAAQQCAALRAAAAARKPQATARTHLCEAALAGAHVPAAHKLAHEGGVDEGEGELAGRRVFGHLQLRHKCAAALIREGTGGAWWRLCRTCHGPAVAACRPAPRSSRPHRSRRT